MSNAHDHVSENVRTTLTVFPILAGLILITVFVHQSHLPYKIQLAIEVIKFCIAIGYFTHLIANRKEINNVWLMTIIFVAGLLLLPLANSKNHLLGTEDSNRRLQMENPAPSAHHSKEAAEEHAESNVH